MLTVCSVQKLIDFIEVFTTNKKDETNKNYENLLKEKQTIINQLSRDKEEINKRFDKDKDELIKRFDKDKEYLNKNKEDIL